MTLETQLQKDERTQRNLQLLENQERAMQHKFNLHDYIIAQKNYMAELYFEAGHEDHSLSYSEFVWEYTCGKYQCYRKSFENMYLGQGHRLDWGAHKEMKE